MAAHLPLRCLSYAAHSFEYRGCPSPLVPPRLAQTSSASLSGWYVRTPIWTPSGADTAARCCRSMLRCVPASTFEGHRPSSHLCVCLSPRLPALLDLSPTCESALFLQPCFPAWTCLLWCNLDCDLQGVRHLSVCQNWWWLHPTKDFSRSQLLSRKAAGL